MAYTLESLLHTLSHILHPHPRQPWLVDPIHRPQIESLLDNARCFNELFENSSLMTGDRVALGSLETRIRDAVYEAEDIIESHFVHQLVSNQEIQKFELSLPDLQKVTEDFDFVKEEIVKLMDRTQTCDNRSPSFSFWPRKAPNPENIVEGISKDLTQLKDRLTGQPSMLQIIPIVGMGGIVKTTPAQTLYDDPLVVEHFDKCAWATVSQDYDLRRILLGLLQCLKVNPTDEINKEENDELTLRLYKALCGRRYFIVLDDTWSYEIEKLAFKN